MKTITQAQYYQLIGLRAAADKQHAILESIVQAAREITDERESDGTPCDSGHTMDYVWGHDDVDDLLRRLKIGVTKPPKRKRHK